MERLHLRIRGRVQGVFFRASVQEKAQELGLAGWVRNRSDGSVEVLAEGDPDALQRLERWCHHGPPRAQVDSVDATWGEARHEFECFDVKH